MKTSKQTLIAAALLCGALAGNLLTLPARAQAPPADPGWPRVFKNDKHQLTVYQPQVDYWNGYTNLHFRCAIAVKGVLKEEKFGVAEVDAITMTDHGARAVAIAPVKRELRFANVPAPEAAALRQAVEQLNPSGKVTTLALDRVLACLDPATQRVQPAAELNLDPPKIFHSSSPAILVMFMGEPKFKPVETNRTDLTFAPNTNWDVLYDTASRQYYLLDGESWLTAPDVLKGPWTPARQLPPSFSSLPANDNWAEARRRLPGKPTSLAPRVFTTTEPAELIVTKGAPSLRAIPGTKLQCVTNTDSVLFRHMGDGKIYFMVAGRWFRGDSPDGPWSAASKDLPPDFAQIPDSDPEAFVKASVPGTREAKDAVMLASIPITTMVNVTNTTVQVVYSGAPQFVAIPSTSVQYAVNSPNQVFLVDGGYYCCSQGMWFCGANANGPWSFCTSVPSAIYKIPPSNPNYNVTYVTVQSSTPTTVVYSQTAGYSGEYVAATGVLMFGMGMLAGAAIANNNDCDYCYPPPPYYSYGSGAVYHYGYGGYYGAGGAAYGPYGGAGHAAGYNPYTGTYARSSSAYGPYGGSASRTAAYNPYSGARAAGGQVSTPYGSAGRAASYNPETGTAHTAAYRSNPYGTASGQRAYDADTGARAAGGQVTTDQGSASRAAGYNPTTGQGAAGRSASGEYGSAGAVKTTSGSGAAAWDTQQGQGAVAKDAEGNVYAGSDGTVYKKDSDGSWSQNSGSGWESAEKQQPQSTATGSSGSASSRQSSQASSQQQQAQSQASSQQQQAQSQASSKQAQAQSQASSAQQQRSASGTTSSSSSQQKQSMESQAQARQSGNQQAQRTSQFQSSSGSRSGGGGRRR